VSPVKTKILSTLAVMCIVVLTAAAPASAGITARRTAPLTGPPTPPPGNPAIAGSDPVRDRVITAPPRQARLAASALRFTGATTVSPGVVFRTFQTTGAAGTVLGDLLDVDLTNQHVSVGLLRPTFIASRLTVSNMANAQHAVAGVNGDFFNISETHQGVTPTGSSDGPEVTGGKGIKAAVPKGQRFGPALPAGTTPEDVIGVGTDGIGRLDRMPLSGQVKDGVTTLTLRGLNQYAIPVDGIGIFTHAWGSVSRERAVCGTDTLRSAPCSTDTAEVTIQDDVVTSVHNTIGSGSIPQGTSVLIGREQGADLLRATFHPGEQVQVGFHLADQEQFRFAVGGFPILRDGAPPDGLSNVGSAPRTAAGVNQAGTHLYLVVVDGSSSTSAGMTLAELSALLKGFGAGDGINLDGGGSSTFVTQSSGASTVTVRNKPADGSQRPVANGIGIIAIP
jgi:hypothetical protein